MLPTAPPESDLLCVACGYDLRGIDAARVCPECGHACEDSRRKKQFAIDHPYSLHAGGKRWQWKFRWGLTLLIAGVFGIEMMMIATALMPRGGWSSAVPLLYVLLMLLGAGGYLLSHAGMMLTAAKRPLPGRRWRVLRWLVLLGPWVSLGALALMIVSGISMVRWLSLEALLYTFQTTIGVTTVLAWMYWGKLMSAHSPLLAKGMRILALLMIAPPVLLLVVEFITLTPNMATSAVQQLAIGSPHAGAMLARHLVTAEEYFVPTQVAYAAIFILSMTAAAMLVGLRLEVRRALR